MSPIQIPEEIRNRHEPMDADDGGYLLCARDDEIWPCDATQLMGLILAAQETDPE